MITLQIHINDLSDDKAITVYNKTFLNKMEAERVKDITINVLNTILLNKPVISFTMTVVNIIDSNQIL